MNLIRLATFITRHPLNRYAPIRALARFARWQIASRLLSRPVALPFVNDTSLVTEPHMTGATGNWYCGLHEVDEMGFVLHLLRPDDLFMDVGANIGSYTVLAAGAAGAQVISVEPLPKTYSKLKRNIDYNLLNSKVTAHCCGLSATAGQLSFTSNLDTMNRVALPGEAASTVSIPVRTMDELCEGRTPVVIKIDVEGHETAVLEGGRATLANPLLLAVLMETNGSGAKFGVVDEKLFEAMQDYGFFAFSYDAIKRELRPANKMSINTVFLRDPVSIEARCKSSVRYKLINGSI